MKVTNHFMQKTLVLMMIGVLCFGGCTTANDGANPAADAGMTVEFSTKEASEVIQETGETEWTYIALGDSMNMTFPSIFMEMMEEDLGIRIKYKRRWIGGDHSSDMLERIRNSESLRADLREADVITVEIPWHAFEEPCRFACGTSTEECDGLSPEGCVARAAEIYMADTDAILAEIVSLCDPSGTLIRTMDTYQFFVSESREAGSFEMINKYWRACNENVIAKSATYNIPTVHAYDAFMGESGEDDPMDSNLVYNGKNLSDEGAQLMAELFREVGYFYAPEE